MKRSLNYSTNNIRTLIKCLTSEAKERLLSNGMFISALTSKQPMFNYAVFYQFTMFTIKLDSFFEKNQLRSQNSQKWYNHCSTGNM